MNTLLGGRTLVSRSSLFTQRLSVGYSHSSCPKRTGCSRALASQIGWQWLRDGQGTLMVKQFSTKLVHCCQCLSFCNAKLTISLASRTPEVILEDMARECQWKELYQGQWDDLQRARKPPEHPHGSKPISVCSSSSTYPTTQADHLGFTSYDRAESADDTWAMACKNTAGPSHGCSVSSAVLLWRVRCCCPGSPAIHCRQKTCREKTRTARRYCWSATSEASAAR